MKKIVVFFAVFASLGVFSLSAQSETDAIKLGKSDPLNGGSARFTGVAGAMGAVGGDYSAITINPATIAVFRRPVVAVTMGGNFNNLQTNWYKTSLTNKKNQFNFNNFSYANSILFSDGSQFSLGVGMHKTMDYRREFRVGTHKGLDYSLADYVAANLLVNGSVQESALHGDGGWDFPYWLGTLGYKAFWVLPVTEGNSTTGWQSSFAYFRPGENPSVVGPNGAALRQIESGQIWNYDITAGYRSETGEWSLGGSLYFSTIDYSLLSTYAEDFPDGNHLYYHPNDPVVNGDYLGLSNSLSTTGVGIGGSIGLIYSPNDNWKLGLAYVSPMFYSMKDQAFAEGVSKYSAPVFEDGKDINATDSTWTKTATTPSDAGPVEYRFVTSHKINASVGYLFGHKGFIDLEYGLNISKGIRLRDMDGGDLFQPDNDAIKEDLGLQHIFRLGGEYNVTNRFAIRAGGFYRTSPMKNSQDVDTDNLPTKVFYTSGTVPQYELPKDSYGFALGTGYKFTPSFYGDLSLVYANQKSLFQTFGKVVLRNGDVMPANFPAKIERRQVQLNVTLGYRF